MTTAERLETRRLKAALRSVGLTLVSPAALPAERRLPTPTPAGDARTDLDTTSALRRLRDW